MPKLPPRIPSRHTADSAVPAAPGAAATATAARRGYAPSRRRMPKTSLGAGIGPGTAGPLAACSATTSGVDTAATSSASGGGAWTFTDDRGTTVRPAATPTRVVAYTGTAAALYDFGVPVTRFAGVFGPTKRSNGSADPMAGNLPVDRLTALGEAYGEFDVAEYARLDPQLLITDIWEKGSLWYVPAASASKIEKLAPTLGIAVADTPLTKPLAAYERLAGLLGADLNASAVSTAKSTYQRAAESLRTTAKVKSSIRVLAASASADLFYVADPAVYPDLSHLRQLGVDLVTPNNVQGGFFESLSWENVDKYAADIILLDDRTTALQPKDLTGKPTWTQLPAVKAGQIVGWAGELRYAYQTLGPVLAGFATALADARKVA
jgi:iron complex transport system substrate-binding protein